MKTAKILRRTLSLCLVLVMILTAIPAAFAADDDLTADAVTVNVKDYKKIKPSHAEASSVMTWGTKKYPADNVLDGSRLSTWREGVKGHGIGESITVYFKKEVEISVIRIYPGYQSKLTGFTNNSRPKEMTLTFSDGRTCTVKLANRLGGQCFKLSEPVTTESIEFTIDKVYKGNSIDTCISEIEFYS